MRVDPSTLFRLMGVPENARHRCETLGQYSAQLHVLINGFGVPYLLVAFMKDEASLHLALRESAIVGTGVLLRDDMDAVAIFRKNFRTGDIHLAAGADGMRLAHEDARLLPGNTRKKTRVLRPLTHQLENVLFEVHSALRDIDGLHAPDALDEICKILYAKIYDEESVGRGGIHRFQRMLYHSVEECAASIRSLYRNAVDAALEGSGRGSPADSHVRGVFRDPLTLSSQAISRTVSLLEHYDLSGSPIDIKGRAFQNVLTPATRAGMGQYFTPKPLIDLLISLLRPSLRDVIIDPFCGSGHFLAAALDHVRRRERLTQKELQAFAADHLHGMEKSDRMVRIAMTDMRMHGNGHKNIRCMDALLPFARYSDVDPGSFDIIVTNPPFGVDLPHEALAELGPFEVLSDRTHLKVSVSLEIVALDRCVSLLRPGGRMAIVLPDSILSNRGTGFVRDWVSGQALIRGIISLPVETFSPFGASIKTSVLLLRKYREGENRAEPYNVFLADLKSIGYDAAGRPSGCDDFEGLKNGFADFIAREGW